VLPRGNAIAFSQASAHKKNSAKEVPGGWRTIFFLRTGTCAGRGRRPVWSTRSVDSVTSGTSTPVKSTLHLETFVLNLAVRSKVLPAVGIDLGLGTGAGKGENAPPVAEVRDTILSVLAQSRVDDLQDEKGKNEVESGRVARAAGAEYHGWRSRKCILPSS